MIKALDSDNKINLAIRLDNLSKQFHPTPLAVDNIQADIQKNGMTGLIGPDGAGKTTLIRLIAGLMKPTQGSISLPALEEADASMHYMPQKFSLYEDLTVLENLHLFARLYGVDPKKREQIFEEAFAFTLLGPFKARLAKNLSGGMKQKLALACVVLNSPKILLLDEPTMGVDPLSRQEFVSMVKQLAGTNTTVVWATSSIDDAYFFEDILLLNAGKLLYQGTPQNLMAQTGTTTFKDAFNAILQVKPADPSVLGAHLSPKPTLSGYAIEALSLCKHFGQFIAAKNINFQVSQGEIFGLLGPNGAGKSTTFRMMCGLIQPTSGKALVSGHDLRTASSTARSHIGYMAQKFSLYNELSIEQNLLFFSGVYGLTGKEQKQAIKLASTFFDFGPFLKIKAGLMPIGYKQRLALACAIMHNPDVLFLDEPTGGVDPTIRSEFWAHMSALSEKGTTIMVTTHFMDEAERCDRIALIFNGQNIAQDSPAGLKNLVRTPENPNPTLESAFIALIKKARELA